MDKQKIKPIFAIIGLYALFTAFTYFAGEYAPYISNYIFADILNRDGVYSYFIMSIALCIILAIILCLSKVKLKDAIRFSKFDLRFVIKLWVFQCAFMFVIALTSWDDIVSIFNALKFWVEALQGKKIMMYQTVFKPHPNINFFMILYAVIVGPIVEELFYRQIIYNKIKTALPIKFSIGITAVLYAASHIRGWTVNINIVYLLFLGILLTYCYEKTENVWASICLHIIYNGFTTLIICLKQNSAILLYLIIFIAALIILIIELIKYLNRRKALNGVGGNTVPDVKE